MWSSWWFAGGNTVHKHITRAHTFGYGGFLCPHGSQPVKLCEGEPYRDCHAQ